MKKSYVFALAGCVIVAAGEARATARERRLGPSYFETSPSERRAEKFAGTLGDFQIERAQVDGERMDDTRALASVLVTVLVGWGIGHMVAGDVPRGMMFLGIELGLSALAIALPIVMLIVTAGSMATGSITPGLIIAFYVVLPITALAMLAVRIWEIIDVVRITGIARQRDRDEEMIRDRRRDVQATPFAPAYANAFSLRF